MNKLRIFLNAFFLDRSKLFGLPTIALTWVLHLAAIAYVVFLINAGAEPASTAIGVGILVFVLAVTLGWNWFVVRYQTSKRQQLYKLWQWDFGLKKYGNSDKDSSIFLKIKWEGLKATSIYGSGEAGKSVSRRVTELEEACVNANKMLPQKNRTWVIDFEAARTGEFHLYTLETGSEAEKIFNAKAKVFEISSNTISHQETPNINFDTYNPNTAPAFNKITISKLQPNSYSEYKITEIETVFNNVFPINEPNKKWKMYILDNSTIEMVIYDHDSPEARQEHTASVIYTMVKAAKSSSMLTYDEYEIRDIGWASTTTPSEFTILFTKAADILVDKYETLFIENLLPTLTKRWSRTWATQVIQNDHEYLIRVTSTETGESATTPPEALGVANHPLPAIPLIKPLTPPPSTAPSASGADSTSRPVFKPLPPLPPLPPRV